MSQYQLKELKVEVTQKCPLNCLHCSSEANISKTQELTESQVISIIHDAKKLGINEIIFSGGEPLLWPSLFIAISHCNNLNIPVTLYTSGTPIILNKNLLSQILKANLKKVVISLYGASQEIHENITRVSGSFKSTIFAIKELVSLGVTVEIHFVAMVPNWKQFLGTVDLAKKLGAKKLSILRFVPHGRGTMVKNTFMLSKNQLLELRKEISNLKSGEESFTIRTGSPFNILLLNQNVFCMAAIDRVTICPDEQVFPCDAFKNLDYGGRLSSLKEGNLIEIWHKSEHLNFVRNVLKEGLGPICSSCKENNKCKGGCLAQKIIRLGKESLYNPDPDCLFS